MARYLLLCAALLLTLGVSAKEPVPPPSGEETEKLQALLGRSLEAEIDRWVFVGDSGNDVPMFQHFTHSVGVANIRKAVDRLPHLPTYISASERGAGFAEVAAAILAARRA